MTLRSYFNPSSIAVVGASNDPGKAGYQIYRNLLDLGFEGPVWAVNPKLPELFDRTCYPTLRDIPGPAELMVISVPAFGTPEIFEQAEARGDVRAAVVIASGFSETKIPERVALERDMLRIAKRAGIRVMGPNCVGVMNTGNHLDTTFAAGIRQSRGGMSVISQSGALGASIMMFATHQPAPMGFAKWAHVGNQSDVDVLEVMRFYRDDPDTRVIAMYMEGINNAKDFLKVAREVTRDKPVIALKVGRSEAGSGAAASHTGSLVGSDAVYDAAFRQAGIIRVDTVEELLDTAKAISMQPLPAGNRIAVLTEAGGPGIIAMDELGLAKDIVMARFGERTIAALKEALPPMAIVDHTPGYVDMSAAADEEHHARALSIALEDPNVDGIVHISVPPTFLRPDELARRTADVLDGARKPVTICYMAGKWITNARRLLEDARIPTFDMPERAARTMRNMVRRAQHMQRSKLGTQEKQDASGQSPSFSAASDVLLRERRDADENLTEPEARKILSDYGIAFERAVAAADADRAAHAFSETQEPTAMKIISRDILHKSDVGGVRVNLRTEAEVRDAYRDMLANVARANPDARIDGVLVSPMAKPGIEMIVGASRDAQFGPVVMVGFGGVLVEVLRDVAFRIAPFCEDEARAMIDELRLRPVLDGVRGGPKGDVDALAKLIVRVGRVMTERSDIAEIDLNPVRVYADGVVPLDARIVLAGKETA